jgi:NADP-dependent 3-hydroxy acid dehydrogenase YdfG
MAGAFIDQIAVVTGASSGIGRALAIALAKQGANLFLIGRQADALNDLTATIQTYDVRGWSFPADLTQDQAIHDITTHLRQQFGRVDILVHSAGAFAMESFEVAPIEDFDHLYRVNVRAPYLLTQQLLPLIKARQGQVVFINSSVGLNARARVSQYAATKHALKAIADSLREEVNAAGVRVVSIYPGRTASPMQAMVYQLENRVYQPEQLIQPEEIAAVITTVLSLPKGAEVTDINIRPAKK